MTQSPQGEIKFAAIVAPDCSDALSFATKIGAYKYLAANPELF
jgi:hypothetical protein